MSIRKTAGWSSLSALILSATLLFTLSTPATAASSAISGTITPCGHNQYYATGRVNALNQNSAFFKATRLGPCGTNTLTVGLRGTKGAAASHAKVTVTNTSSTFKFKATNGASYISGGTFYVTGHQAGACGPCTGSFAGNLTYSVPAG
ncbi:hypothetical protein [Curtobacterium sp. MCBA15_008]|uniref:hypothetical protein n=1 Tax=Curtobacterium sp. MCBA15_008 TaxID=1898736 RepID=UPI0008DD9EBC|nr:hypothetical protein [Curtobacterium sp. MCBA15_008]OII14439.1 hypothetical protein BIU96_10945 [Curtobacterium sp. MCBA15_008]